MTTKQDAMEAAARAAYIAHHNNGPTEEAFDEPNMGRGGFKTEVVVWNAVAQAAVQAYLAAREVEGWAQECLGAVLCAGELFTSDGHFKVNQEKALENLRGMLAARPTNG